MNAYLAPHDLIREMENKIITKNLISTKKYKQYYKKESTWVWIGLNVLDKQKKAHHEDSAVQETVEKKAHKRTSGRPAGRTYSLHQRRARTQTTNKFHESQRTLTNQMVRNSDWELANPFNIKLATPIG